MKSQSIHATSKNNLKLIKIDVEDGEANNRSSIVSQNDAEESKKTLNSKT